jgi:hypothetical protein
MVQDARGCDARAPFGPASRRWLILTTVLAAFLQSASANAGNIFEDDWTPPPPRKTVPLPPAFTGTTQPVTPSETPSNVPKQQAPGDKSLTTAPQMARPPQALSLRAIPAREDQARARKLFRELFTKDLMDQSLAGRRALAMRLLDEAAKVPDAATDQFVLLLAATEAGKDASDLRLCMRATTTLASSYEVDGAKIAADAAVKMNLRAPAPTVVAANFRAALELVEQLITRDDFAAAARLLSLLRSVSTGNVSVMNRVRADEKSLDVIRSATEKIAPSRELLKTEPNNSAANLAVGRYLCWMKNDWDQGLPLLARGSDPVLKALATKDMTSPAGDAAFEVAEAWWKISEKEPLSLPQKHLQSHADLCFKKALPALSALSKSLAEQRIAEFDASNSVELTIELLPTMTGTAKAMNNGIAVLSQKGRIETTDKFRAPVTFHIALFMATETDLRLGYAANQIIFNWERNHDELRVDGGPPDGQHKPGAGRLPTGQWVAISLAVKPDEMILSVNGIERHRIKANFSSVDEPLSISAVNGEIKIKSVGFTTASNP